MWVIAMDRSCSVVGRFFLFLEILFPPAWPTLFARSGHLLDLVEPNFVGGTLVLHFPTGEKSHRSFHHSVVERLVVKVGALVVEVEEWLVVVL